MASPLTVWARTSGGYLTAINSSYSSARDGVGATPTTGNTTSICGQQFSEDYYVREAFLTFDTSSITSGNSVSLATLSLWGQADSSTTNFTIEIFAFDWTGSGLTAADWRTGAAAGQLSDLYDSGAGLLASYNTTSSFSTSAYNVLTSASAFQTAINKTGDTALIAASSRTRGSNTPTTLEQVVFYDAEDNTGGGGTDRDPKLYIEYTSGSAPTVTDVDPASGVPADSVTITGTGFTGATSVKFGGQSTSFTVVSDSSITATVPSGFVAGVPSAGALGGPKLNRSVPVTGISTGETFGSPPVISLSIPVVGIAAPSAFATCPDIVIKSGNSYVGYFHHRDVTGRAEPDNAFGSQITSSAADYTDCRNGAGTLTYSTGSTVIAGDRYANSVYDGYEAFLKFDTGQIGSQHFITAASLLMSTTTTGSIGLYCEVRAFDFGDTVTTADFRTSSQLNGLPTFGTARDTSTTANVLFAIDGEVLSTVNKSGSTRFVLNSLDFIIQPAPTGNRFVTFNMDGASTTQPVLYVEWTLNQTRSTVGIREAGAFGFWEPFSNESEAPIGSSSGNRATCFWLDKPLDGPITDIYFYVSNWDTPQNTVAFVKADGDGSPSHPHETLGQSDSRTVAQNPTRRWEQFTLSTPVDVDAGGVWIGLMTQTCWLSTLGGTSATHPTYYGDGTYPTIPDCTTASGWRDYRAYAVCLPFGTATADQTTRVNVDEGIASGEAFGSISCSLTIPLAGIATGEAFGTPQVNLTVPVTGIATGEAFGTPQGNLTVPVAGIASEEAFGTTTVALGAVTCTVSAIGAEEAFGALIRLLGAVSRTLAGISSGEQWPGGTPTEETVATTTGTQEGEIESVSATYSTARDSGNCTAYTGNNIKVGQYYSGVSFICYEGFISFSLGSYSAGYSVTAARLELFLQTDRTTGSDFVIEVRQRDWGSSLTTADWVSGDSLSSLPLLGSLSTFGIGATGSWKTITFDSGGVEALRAALGSNLRVILDSDRHVAGTVPTDHEDVVFLDIDYGSAPRVVFTLVPPGGPSVILGVVARTASAIPSAEEFGTTTVAKGAVTRTLVAIDTEEAFGTVTCSVGAVTRTTTAITSGEVFGTTSITQTSGTQTRNLENNGIASDAAFGALKTNVTVPQTGIDAGEAYGTLKTNLFLVAVGVAAADAYGTAETAYTVHAGSATTGEGLGAVTITGQLTVLIAAIDTAVAFGSTNTQQAGTQVGIPSGEAFGTTTTKQGGVARATAGIDTAEVFGAVTIALRMVGIASGEALGTVTVALGAVSRAASGVDTGEAFGSVSLTLSSGVFNAGGIFSDGYGSVTVLRGAVTRTLVGVDTAAAFGAVTIVLHVVGIPTDEAFGTPAVAKGAVTRTAVSIDTAEAFGIVRSAFTIYLSGIATAEVHGATTTAQGGVSRATVGIAGAETFGSIRANFTEYMVGVAGVDAYGATTTKQGTVSRTLSGVPAEDSFGSLTLSLKNLIANAGGLGSTAAFGAVIWHVTIPQTGIASSAAYGDPIIHRVLPLSGVPSAAAFGGISIGLGTGERLVAGITSGEEFGSAATKQGNVNRTAGTIDSAEAFGTVTVPLLYKIAPAGITTEEGFGPAVAYATYSIGVSGIASGEAVQSSGRYLNYRLSIVGIDTALAFGGLMVSSGTIYATLVGIDSAAAFGGLKLNWTMYASGIAATDALGVVARVPGAVSRSVVGFTNGVLGRTDLTGLSASTVPANYQSGHRAALPEPARFTAICAYLAGTGTGTQQYRFNIYADNAGTPGALLAQTAVGSITYPSPYAWRRLEILTPVVSGSGNYWLMQHNGETNNVISSYRIVGSYNGWIVAPDTFADGPSDPLAAGGGANGREYAIYAEYDFILGSATLQLTVARTCTGIASSEAFGTPKLNQNEYLIGIASGDAYGTASAKAGVLSPPVTGIESEEAFGSISLALGSGSRVVSGIPSDAAFGATTTQQGGVSRTLSGVDTAEAFGATVAKATYAIDTAGIATGEALGSVSTPFTIHVVGISSESVLQPVVVYATVSRSVSGIATGEALGVHTTYLLNLLAISSIGAEQQFGTASRSVGGVSRALSGISSSSAFGTASLRSMGSVEISGVPAEDELGQPTLIWFYTIHAQGIASAELYGAAQTQALGLVHVLGIASALRFGRTRARQVWYGKKTILGNMLGKLNISGTSGKQGIAGSGPEDDIIDGIIE